MFENNVNWTISNQAPFKWRRFNDYPIWSRIIADSKRRTSYCISEEDDIVSPAWKHVAVLNDALGVAILMEDK